MSSTYTDGVTPLDASHMNALHQKVEKGLANGYASPDASVKVPVAQLPANVGQSLVGTYAARPAASTVAAGTVYYCNDTLTTFRSDGSSWTYVAQSVAHVPISNFDSPPWSTPYNGMEVLLTDNLGTPTYAWRLRYNQFSSSAYKWEFVGGPALGVQQVADQTLAGNDTWGDLATVGPSITAPRAGQYLISAGCGVYNTAAACIAQYVGVTIGAGTPAFPFTAATAVPAAGQGYWMGIQPSTPFTAAAGDSIRMRYRVYTGTGSFNSRVLSITPVRVS